MLGLHVFDVPGTGLHAPGDPGLPVLRSHPVDAEVARNVRSQRLPVALDSRDGGALGENEGGSSGRDARAPGADCLPVE